MSSDTPEGLTRDASPSASFTLDLKHARVAWKWFRTVPYRDAGKPTYIPDYPTAGDLLRASLNVLVESTRETNNDEDLTAIYKIRDYLHGLDEYNRLQNWQGLKHSADTVAEDLESHLKALFNKSTTDTVTDADYSALGQMALHAFTARGSEKSACPDSILSREGFMWNADKVARAYYRNHDEPAWVCVYSHVVEGGGPEEGGWYYHDLQPLACFPIPHGTTADEALESAKAWGRSTGLTFKGDLVQVSTCDGVKSRVARPANSASPEVDAVAYCEAVPFQSATTERPRYE